MQIDNNKLKGMLYGAFYGDAYSLGGHWVYDTEVLQNGGLNLDTCNNPLSSYHPTKKEGDFTHYGDQMFWLLQNLVKEDKFSLVDFGDVWHENMKEYDGYIDGPSKHTIQKLSEERNYFACGSSSSDLSAVSRIFPLIVKYHNSTDDMIEAIKLHTIITHMNKDLLQAGYFFSELAIALLRGGDLEKSIDASYEHFGENIKTWVMQAKEVLSMDTPQAIAKLGQSCGVNGAFASTIYILLKYQNSFKDALRENMLAGGESSARGMIVGALLGIIHNEDVLKGTCVEQINVHKDLKKLVDKLL